MDLSGGGGLGLAAGIAQGLNEGVQSYLQTRNMVQETAIKKQLANAQSGEAFAKMIDIAGRGNAQDIAKSQGIVPQGFVFSPEQSGGQGQQDQQPTQIMGPPSDSGQPNYTQASYAPGQAPPANAPENVVQGYQQSGGAPLLTKAQLMNLPKSVRGIEEDRIKDANQRNTVSGQAKVKSELMGPYMELSRKFDSRPETQTLAATTKQFNQLMDADYTSPTGAQKIKKGILSIENEGKPTTESDLEAAKGSQDYLSRYKDLFTANVKSGISESTANDAKATACRNMIALHDTWKNNALNPALQEAGQWGVPAGFTSRPEFDAAYQKAVKFLAKHGKYVSPAEEAAQGAKGLLAQASQKFAPATVGAGPTARAQKLPKVGEVQQGYRFQGGDPASPSSWKKVK